ncbi:hypothetical protein SeLEV6574_g03094 [Synchytrium endobioticum]|uniref:RING-type domain-containing protein n=1 Tax=Synchytrium endobioticum TaxID=286115 RepID=A0A507D5B9_9FUNG|nr:hypothetical protein SeLEV6574_g03094 [Synchytrium endobioticum]
MKSNPHMHPKQRKQILAFVVFHLMACAFNPALAMDGRDIVPSGSAGRHGSRGRHGRMGSSYGGNTRDAIGHEDMMGGSSGISGMDEPHDMGTSQHAASSSSGLHSTRPLTKYLAELKCIIETVERLCADPETDVQELRLKVAKVKLLWQEEFERIFPIGQSESESQEDKAEFMEWVGKQPPRWRFEMRKVFNNVVCRLEGREPDARPQLLKTDPEVQEKYSIVLGLIYDMFRELSNCEICQQMRDGWKPRHFNSLIYNKLRSTYQWLEENSVGDNPWQNPGPSESSALQGPLESSVLQGPLESSVLQGPSESSALEGAEQCPICRDGIDAVSLMVLPCGHQLHRHCFYELAFRGNSCPLCRRRIW